MNRARNPLHDLNDRIRLIRSPGIGPITYRQLLQRFGSAGEAITAIPDLARRGRGKPPQIAAPAVAERERAAVERLGGHYVALGDQAHPRLLSQMDDASPLLTVKGDFALFQRPMVAMVGARNASAAACRFARGMARDLGLAGQAIVSGLARGIDSAAHDGSIDTGTIAVIAGELDVIYPPEKKCGRQILRSADCWLRKCRRGRSRAPAIFPTVTASSPDYRQESWWWRPRPNPVR